MSGAADLDGNRASLRLWIVAGAVAVLLHAGCVALAVTKFQGNDDDGGLGVNAIEVGLELESTRAPETDLPAGQDSDASAASPAVMEQKAEVKETELPKAVPNEADEPDRAVTPDDSKKPKDEESEKAVVQQSASTEAVAAEASARQSFDDAKEGEKQIARNIGLAKKDQKLLDDWHKKLSAYFELHKVFPAADIKRNASVKVSFTLNRVGNVLSVSVAESSGNAAIDKAAMEMIRRSDPVPRPPTTVMDDQLVKVIEVKFNPPK